MIWVGQNLFDIKKKKKDKKTHYDTKQIPHASQFALLRIP